jgi:signal transduction histidine kinase
MHEDPRRSAGARREDLETFFTSVLDSLYSHVAVIEKDGRIVAVNEAWRRFASRNDARSPSAVSEGANYFEVCSNASDEGSEYAWKAMEGIKSVLEGRKKMFTMEYPCSSPDETRYFVMVVVPLKRPEGGGVVTHTNITRRIQAEKELLESREEYRDITRQLLSAREDASRRLARELHDSFSQRIALISMMAARMQIECAGEKIEENLKRIQSEMKKLSGDVHDISRQLHPSIIEELGLSDAVASFCRSFAGNEGIPVDFDTSGIPVDMKRETAINIYRIIQESMNNAAKHSKAERIKVMLKAAGGSVSVSVSDDGTGFDPEAVRGKKRLGLVSLRERAALIGGTLKIKSSPGRGTTVSVEAPLEPPL